MHTVCMCSSTHTGNAHTHSHTLQTCHLLNNFNTRPQVGNAFCQTAQLHTHTLSAGIKILSDIMHELCKLFLFLLLSLIFVIFLFFFSFLCIAFFFHGIGGSGSLHCPCVHRVRVDAVPFIGVCVCVCMLVCWSAAFGISIWLMLTCRPLSTEKKSTHPSLPIFSAVSNRIDAGSFSSSISLYLLPATCCHLSLTWLQLVYF